MRKAAFAFLLCICACVGPDYVRPEMALGPRVAPDSLPAETASADIALGAAQRFDEKAEIPAEWWHLFRSAPLDALVRQAIDHSPTLAAAQASLRQAEEQTEAQRGQFFPQISGGFSPSWNRTALGAVSPASATGNPDYSLFTLQGAVSFVPDVFGANARAVESLEAQAENQRFQMEATFLTLTANVVVTAIQEANLNAQIDLTREIVDLEQKLLAILERQHQSGQVARADVLAQEAALASAETALPPLRKQLAATRDQLAVLCGSPPADGPGNAFALEGFSLPVEVPDSVPATILEQRPDIRAAEALLHSASAEIGVAIAARLPQITITGNYGNESNRLGALFGPGTQFWTIAGNLTAPIFDGFTLLHKERAARAAYEAAAEQYRAAVLMGLQNVADTLQALHADAEAMRAAVHAYQAAEKSLGVVKRQAELGQVAVLALLNAQQTYSQARLGLVQAQASRLADTAALYQALGGGWWNRPPQS